MSTTLEAEERDCLPFLRDLAFYLMAVVMVTALHVRNSIKWAATDEDLTDGDKVYAVYAKDMGFRKDPEDTRRMEENGSPPRRSVRLMERYKSHSSLTLVTKSGES